MKSAARILIIDDDTSVQSVLSSALADNYAVQVASTGEEGLRHYDQVRPDIVLLDVMLPEMSGLSVLRALRKKSTTTPIIMMTAFAQVRTAVEAIKLGAADYLEKPLNPQRVISEIEQLVSARAIPPSTVRERIAGDSPAMQQVWRIVERFAPTNIPILLQGESGTGKGAFARAIQSLSKRAQGPFVEIDCSTIPEQLAESELFGYEDGAFTGAGQKKIGRVAFADHGTIFLDEIGVLTFTAQSKLLTLIEQQTFVPLGSRDARTRQVDVRFISATNVPLLRAIENGTFREDLYHRLNGIIIELPPLRERGDDLELLVRHFLGEMKNRYAKPELEISDDGMNLLLSYTWPGNVRELQRVIAAAAVMAEETITPDDLPLHVRNFSKKPLAFTAKAAAAPAPETDLSSLFLSGKGRTLHEIKEWAGREAEKQVIRELQRETNATRQELAKMLGVDPKTLRSRLREIAAHDTPDLEN
jgi:DNA-binding NtrC family response regulator